MINKCTVEEWPVPNNYEGKYHLFVKNGHDVSMNGFALNYGYYNMNL